MTALAVEAATTALVIPDSVVVALISAIGLVLSGVLVELVRTRKHTAKVSAELAPNHGSSLRDAVNRIERDVRDMRTEQNKHSERLAVVEVLVKKES